MRNIEFLEEMQGFDFQKEFSAEIQIIWYKLKTPIENLTYLQSFVWK